METYKSGQGSFARLAASLALLLAAALGCQELYSWIADPNGESPIFGIEAELFRNLPLISVPLSWKLLICVAIFVGLIWLLRVYMTRPATVDLLIETEMELKKVSWPTREESLNATWVVLLVTIVMTLSLWLFDGGLRLVLSLVF